VPRLLSSEATIIMCQFLYNSFYLLRPMRTTNGTVRGEVVLVLLAGYLMTLSVSRLCSVGSMNMKQLVE
jgi:hypothetical protein